MRYLFEKIKRYSRPFAVQLQEAWFKCVDGPGCSWRAVVRPSLLHIHNIISIKVLRELSVIALAAVYTLGVFSGCTYPLRV